MEKMLVLDFGGQYNQLIARRVRENHVYAEIKPYNGITLPEIKAAGYKGIIFTGGPDSVYEKGAPSFDPEILNCGIPLLGICYGAQLIAHLSKGKVEKADNSSEYGKTILLTDGGILVDKAFDNSVCWMSHTDYLSSLPANYEIVAHTEKCPIAAFEDTKKNIYGLQFHPEVTHTVHGMAMIRSFVLDVCGCKQDWRMEDFIESSVRKYRDELKGKKVLLALSGGVDSSVAAVLLHKAIGHDLHCVFVDHGLLRKDEGEMVEKVFREGFDLNLVRINAEDRFLAKLKGVTEPEQKRKIIGEEFIRVFEEEALKAGCTDVLAQGTIYPDIVESGKNKSAVIKSHHNVGGLPENIAFTQIVEPLKELFKDEVREVGLKLGIPYELVYRQPFPGPGLAVRITGEITKEKLAMLKEADSIFRTELESNAIVSSASQYFAVLTDTKAVGVIGDARTYGYVLALRSVTTEDFMTADRTRLPYELLETVSDSIINEVRGIARIVYDITSKPPGTVEWE